MEYERFVVDTGVTDHRMTAVCVKYEHMSKSWSMKQQKQRINFAKFEENINKVDWDLVNAYVSGAQKWMTFLVR